MARLIGLLSFQGRLSRLGYWRAYLALMVWATLVLGLGYFAIIVVGRVGAILLLPILPILVATAAILVRRFHDRGRSGWWAFALLLAPNLVVGPIVEYMPQATLLLLVTGLAALVLNIWGLVEFGFRRGTPGDNRYGPEPPVGG